MNLHFTSPVHGIELAALRGGAHLSTTGTIGPFLRDGSDFTLLFEQAILSLIPCALFLIAAVWRITSLLSQKNIARPGFLLYGKLVLNSIVFSLQLGLVVLWVLTDIKTPVSVAASSLNLTATGLLFFLSYLEHKRSASPSILIGSYLWTTTILDIAQARSLFFQSELLNGSKVIGLVFLTSKIAQFALALLEETSKRSLLPFRADGWPAETMSGFLGRCLFLWLGDIFTKGYSGSLRMNTLGSIDDALKSRKLLDKLQVASETGDSSDEHYLLGLLWSAFKRPLLWALIPRFFLTIFSFSKAFLIKKLVAFAEDPTRSESIQLGKWLVVGTAVIFLGSTLSQAMFTHLKNRLYTLVRGTLVAAILDKTLRSDFLLSTEDAATTLMSSDVESLSSGIDELIGIVPCTFELILAGYLLQVELGSASYLVALPGAICTYLSDKASDGIGPARGGWAGATQLRVSTTTSFLSQIKSLKMMGLTDLVSKTLHRLRTSEQEHAKKFRMYIVWIMGIANFSQHLTPASVILGAIFWTRSGGEGFTISQAFTSLAILDLIAIQISNVSTIHPTLVAANACLQRIQTFLVAHEHQDSRILASNSSESASLTRLPPRVVMAKLQQVSVSLQGQKDPVLHEITLEIEEGTISVIVGSVGSGKSVLLKLLLGEIRATHGTVALNLKKKSVAFCDQTPWLRNVSVQENIVAEHEYDDKWYEKVIRACCLDHDIVRFPERDRTIVGSGGVSLSGGQKHRVALARALYSRNETLVLDDIFSALDSATTKKIAAALFGSTGLLKANGITVVFVTHSTHFLQFADNIIVLGSSGKIEQTGSYAKLKSQDGYNKSLQIQDSTTSSGPEDDISSPETETSELASAAKEEEKHELETAADWDLYKFYLSTVEKWYIFVFILLGSGYIWAGKLPAVWLRIWTEHGTTTDTALYFTVYILCCFSAVILAAVAFWWFGIHVIPRSGVYMHEILVESYLRAPLWFLAGVDNGSILNRFSQDLSIVDQQMPFAFFEVVLGLADTLGSAAIICSGAPYVSGIMLLSLGVIYVIQKFYLKTSSMMRHLDLESKAPLYTFFTETRTGIATIRAFGLRQNFLQDGLQILDNSQKPYYLMFCIQLWLDVAIGLFVTMLSVLLVLFVVSFPSTTSQGAIGLSMLYMMGFAGNLWTTVTAWTKMEISLGAAARVRAFVRDTPDENLELESTVAPADWPWSGEIKISQVDAAYKLGDAPVLKQATITAKPGQKIGICGRTGAGKSSLLLTLLRLIETTSGSIVIDGIDLSTLTRESIRSQLTVLPQDPIQLPGTVRENLQPGGPERPVESHPDSDIELMVAIQKLGIWAPVVEAGGLDADFSDLNLSHGQRQQFAVARTLLQRSKIVLLDEATSSVDYYTDKHVQDLMREVFAQCTVLIVAHRLDSIVDCDSIVVIDNGRIVEVGNPQVLKSQEGSSFKKLWDEGHS